MSTVAEYYAEKNVLVSGGTGFVGKVLVQKLLQSCPEIGRVYLLMRPRRGIGAKCRLSRFISSKVFDNIRSRPHIFEKLHLIRGDLLLENLGISDEDAQLLRDDCHVVFHCAANVKFDAPLREAVDMNVVGSHRMLELAKSMKNLEVFVHLSTTYCRADLPVLEETLYPTKHDPLEVIRVTRWLDAETLQHLESKLISPQPTTYSYTKCLAESLVSQYEGCFPIAIARPSIVTASLREPFPGWVDNMNGPTGIIVGAGKGPPSKITPKLTCVKTLAIRFK
ncbi:unnamed protein product [Leptosia nina]|uniref:Fatty acyl-CoA reductase n=1 Tax=Leptosia nina TaxID=320188 RepID=A0AAV1JCM6_9NEOP